MKCKNCENEAVKYGKYSSEEYCSRSCANTRRHSKETVDKIRKSVLEANQLLLMTKPDVCHGPKKRRFPFKCPYCKTVIQVIKSRIKIRKTCGSKECYAKHMSEFQKELLSQGKRINNWGGRCKKMEYSSRANGIIKVDGSFELEFCKWCDRNDISFKRNRVGFRYLFEGKEHSYFPDFSIQDSIFIETKGYETEKDRAKWLQFPYPLIVLRKSQIRLMKKDLMNSLGELHQFLYK